MVCLVFDKRISVRRRLLAENLCAVRCNVSAGGSRIFMHRFCTGRKEGQKEILPKQNRHVGKMKGRENSRPEIKG